VAHGSGEWLDLETFLLDLYKAAGEYGMDFYSPRYFWKPRFAAAAGKDALPAGEARSRAFWMDDEGVWAANAILSTFVHLGLVERGRSGGEKSGRWCFRLTETGRAVFGAPEIVRVETVRGEERCLTVQPNYEVLLYLDAADGVAVSMLGQIAARSSAQGIVQSFTLSRESVYSALEGGLTPDAIESFLAERSRTPLPANVSRSLAEWSRKRESLVVRSGVTLVANPTGQAVTGRATGSGFFVAAASAARRVASTLGVPLETETPERSFTADESGQVVEETPISLVGRARLCRFATRSKAGWRITPESLREARAKGIGGERILGWLAAHLRDEVPPALALAIGNWAGRRTSVFLGEIVVLQIGDPMAFTALLASERLRPLIEGAFAEGCLAVKAERVGEVRALLAEMGFALADSWWPIPPATGSHQPVAEPGALQRRRRHSRR
jgi:hypothetical protein